MGCKHQLPLAKSVEITDLASDGSFIWEFNKSISAPSSFISAVLQRPGTAFQLQGIICFGSPSLLFSAETKWGEINACKLHLPLQSEDPQHTHIKDAKEDCA